VGVIYLLNYVHFLKAERNACEKIELLHETTLWEVP